MKSKIIFCLALVLSGGLFGCQIIPKDLDDTSVRKVKFTEAELVGTYRMPIFSDRYVWLGRNGGFFTHFNDNYDAFGNWSLQEGMLIVAWVVPGKTNTPANYAFFRPLKANGSGVTIYNGLKFKKHSIALQWMQSLPRDVPKRIGDLDSSDWFLRDSHSNEIFINNCGTNTLQNQNPTEAEIHAAIFALDKKRGDVFFSLGHTPVAYIQATGDAKAGFELEYQQDDHYRAKGKFTADEVTNALRLYLKAGDDWKKIANWKKLTFDEP